MNYMSKKTYMRNMPVVLLVEPEAEAMALYARHLNASGLMVVACSELTQALAHIAQASPHVVIINPSSDLKRGTSILLAIAALHPALPVITIGSAIPEDYLDRFMQSGVTMHINRALSQPRDIVAALNHIITERY